MCESRSVVDGKAYQLRTSLTSVTETGAQLLHHRKVSLLHSRRNLELDALGLPGLSQEFIKHTGFCSLPAPSIPWRAFILPVSG